MGFFRIAPLRATCLRNRKAKYLVRNFELNCDHSVQCLSVCLKATAIMV